VLANADTYLYGVLKNMLSLIHTTAVFFTALCIALSAHLANAMTLDQNKRVELADEMHEVNQKQLDETIGWLEELSKTDAIDVEILTNLARLKFFRAINDDDKSARIKKYQQSIDDSENALKLEPNNTAANFWKAAAIGKQGLDIGISKALKNAHPMKDCLDIVLKKNEAYDNAGAHRALGRLYYELPGWPISFGDNKLAREHLQKAVDLSPKTVSNHVYLAQVLIKLGEKDQAKKELAFVKSQPVNPNHKKESAEYLELAEKLNKKLD
jgi:tetratricopeptide (TPR) repeat protein